MWLAGGRGVAAVLRTRRAYPELRNGPAMSVWGSRHLPPFRARPACSRPRREKNREAPRDLIQRHALAGARAGVGLDRPRSFRTYGAWRPQPGARSLEIFVRQTALTLQSIASAAAHTLKGSARRIGAWRVAEAAERLEPAATSAADAAAMLAAIAELEAARIESRLAIGLHLLDH